MEKINPLDCEHCPLAQLAPDDSKIMCARVARLTVRSAAELTTGVGVGVTTENVRDQVAAEPEVRAVAADECRFVLLESLSVTRGFGNSRTLQA
ncbi:hypothetical protein KDA23_06585 [Candidatus Saccharibacteria bacterium]|nr:hypothetical protein [Candidatus Saccharibacteria bacterium]